MRILPDPPGQPKPIHLWHLAIHQQHVIGLSPQRRQLQFSQRAGTIRQILRRDLPCLERLPQDQPVGGVVVDNQHPQLIEVERPLRLGRERVVTKPKTDGP